MESQMKAYWVTHFEKVWSCYDRLVGNHSPIPSHGEQEAEKSNSAGYKDDQSTNKELILNQLILHSVSSYMASQDERIKTLEMLVNQKQVQVLSPSCKDNVERAESECYKSPFTTPQKLTPTNSVNGSPSSEESFSSPSLFSNSERRRSPRFKSKENHSPLITTSSPLKSQGNLSPKSPILKQRIQLKQSKLVLKREDTDSNEDQTGEKNKVRAKLDFKPVLETTKSSARQPVTSLSRKPKLRQTTLDTKLVEEYEMKDITKSEEFKGGFRIPQVPENLKQRIEVQKNDPISNVSKLQPLRTVSTAGAMNASSSSATGSDGFGNFSDDDVDLDATCFISSTPLQIITKPIEAMSVPTTSSPMKRPRTPDESEDDDERKHKIGDNTMKLIQEFDRLPTERSNNPGYAFKEQPIRTKSGKINSMGTTCAQCKEYYEELASQLNTQDYEKILNKCSKHRTNRRVELPATPPDYWRSDIPSTAECIEKGLLQVESQPYVRRPRPKARYRMN